MEEFNYVLCLSWTAQLNAFIVSLLRRLVDHFKQVFMDHSPEIKLQWVKRCIYTYTERERERNWKEKSALHRCMDLLKNIKTCGVQKMMAIFVRFLLKIDPKQGFSGGRGDHKSFVGIQKCLFTDSYHVFVSASHSITLWFGGDPNYFTTKVLLVSFHDLRINLGFLFLLFLHLILLNSD